MASFLVPYGTAADRTPAAVDRLRQTLERRGHEVTDVEAAVFPANVSIEGFDAVVVAATGGPDGPEDAVEEFARSQRGDLMDAPTALVQCCPTALVVDPADRARAAAQLEGLLTRTAWYPDRVAALDGPLAYARHGFLRLLDLERLAADADAASDDGANGSDGDGGDDDAWGAGFEAGGDDDGEDEEALVDEGAVAAVAADVAAFVDGRLGPGPSAARDGSGEESRPDDRP